MDYFSSCKRIEICDLICRESLGFEFSLNMWMGQPSRFLSTVPGMIFVLDMFYGLDKEYFFSNKRTIHRQNGIQLLLCNSWFGLSQSAFYIARCPARDRLLQSPSNGCSLHTTDVSWSFEFVLATNCLMLQEEMWSLYHGVVYWVSIWWFFWKFHVMNCNDLNKRNRLW